jgi:hypothetical protein
MAFPSSPSDYDEHTESNAHFYALGGFWSRRRLPEGGYAKGKAVHSPQTWLPGLNMPHASQMMIVNMVYETVQDTNVYVKIYDRNAGDWIPKTKYDDPSGFVWWGTDGVTSTHWDKTHWGASAINPSLRHSTRNVKAGRPQWLRMTFLRAGPNKTMLAWENHSQIVTGEYQVDNYAKMAIGVDIEAIVSVAIVADDGNFKNINIVTEVY